MQQHINKNNFTINVNGKTYNVTAIREDGHCNRFKIAINCEYLFTLRTDDNGNWQMEKDVTPLNDSLADEIGKAIEEYDTY